MRRTRHRRRFHTDRVVAARRNRYLRETDHRAESRALDHDDWLAKHLSYGRLAVMDPWDCGRRCLLCHCGKFTDHRRVREERAWRSDLGQDTCS